MESISKALNNVTNDICLSIPDLINHSTANPIAAVDDLPIKNEATRKENPVILNAYFHEIDRAFDLLCASPVRSELFVTGYQFPNLEELSFSQQDQCSRYISDYEIFRTELINGEEDIYVNINKDIVQELVKGLCHLAKMHRSGTNSRRFHKVMFLIGNMGEGKTIFCNYLLSVHIKDFEKSNVIPIKIDLTDRDVDANENVSNLLYRKFIRILCENHIGKIITVQEIMNTAQDLAIDSSEQAVFRTYIETCGNNTNESSCHESSQVNKGTIEELFRLVRVSMKNKGYSILYIIDGLDNFNRDMISRNKFLKRSDEVLKYVRKIDTLDDAYIIVTRKESYEYIKIKNEGRGHSHKLRSIKLLPLSSCEIISKKNELAKSLINDFELQENVNPRRRRIEEISVYSEERKAVAIKLKDNLEQIYQLVIDMINYSFKNIPKSGNKLVIDKIFDSNNRRILDAYVRVFKDILNRIEILAGRNYTNSTKDLYCLVENYIVTLLNNDNMRKDFIKRYHYIVIHSLMINKLYLCFPRFRIDSGDKHEDFISMSLPSKDTIQKNFGPIAKSNIWDCTLLPNILDISSPEQYDLNKFSIHYLSQIRILQYLKYVKQSTGHPPKFAKIAKELQKYFNYNPAAVRAELRTLYANQCINVPQPDSPSNSPWILSPLGEHLIDILLYQYNYIINCVDHIKLPDFFVTKYISPSVSLAQLENIYRDKPKLYNMSFGKLLAKKIYYSIATTAMIKKIDDLEKEYFIKKNKKNYFSFNPQNASNDLLIGQKLQDNVLGVAGKILLGRSEFIKKDVKPAFEDIIEQKANN